jgi:hypothetical protein
VKCIVYESSFGSARIVSVVALMRLRLSLIMWQLELSKLPRGSYPASRKVRCQRRGKVFRSHPRLDCPCIMSVEFMVHSDMNGTSSETRDASEPINCGTQRADQWSLERLYGEASDVKMTADSGDSDWCIKVSTVAL